jgi:hypothetical protein
MGLTDREECYTVYTVNHSNYDAGNSEHVFELVKANISGGAGAAASYLAD